MNREELLNRIRLNDSILIVFVTATWCAPCKTIKPYVEKKIMECECDCIYLDVDKDSDSYAALKSKKQFKGVPTLLGYVKGNHSLVSDICISGTNVNEIDCFFESLCFL
jgi:thiol-disulfide isomerase/thioredoxin